MISLRRLVRACSPFRLRLAVPALILSFGCGIGAARTAQDAAQNQTGAAVPPLPRRDASQPEAIAWTQQARNLGELRNLEFSLIVDGQRIPLRHATCDEHATAAGVFACRAPLPVLPDGQHAVRVVSSVRASGTTSQDTAPSLPLTISVQDGRTVMTSDDPAPRPPLAGGSRRARAQASPIVRWATGLDAPRLLTPLSRDRVLFVSGDAQMYSATRTGAVPIAIATTTAGATRILAIAVPHDDATGRVFVAWAVGSHNAMDVQVRQYVLTGNRLGNERLVARMRPAGSTPGALMAFGPDGKLYVVLPSSSRSPIFRYNDDGTVPAEHGSRQALFAEGPPEASAIAWNPRTAELWCVGHARDGAQTLVFPTRGGNTFARLPLAGQPPGGAWNGSKGKRMQPQWLSSLVFLTGADMPAADAIAVVPDGEGLVVRFSVGETGAVRITGHYPSGADGRITELSASGGTVFVVLEPADGRGPGTIGAVSGAYASR